MQEQLDKEIKQLLESYLNNSGNSVSGTNFQSLLFKLNLIHNQYQVYAKEYALKTKLLTIKNHDPVEGC